MECYTVEEAATMLCCSPETVAERIDTGDLPAVKFGRGWIIPAQALDQRINEIALCEAEKRRQQREAGQEVKKVINKAKGQRKARVPPALPSIN
jgi:excisionase family DNA binding protein